jgi:hypothetical protein
MAGDPGVLPSAPLPPQAANPGASQLPVEPKTTFQEDLTTAGQRRINLIWEYTQAAVALMVVLTNMLIAAWLAIAQPQAVSFPQVLSNTLFLVVGFYFSRTNHAAIGGVGPKPEQKYDGR